MSRFVEECQREWRRLGVPDAAANEMAADLEADLAEAEADGVSPEEVVGSDYFDARSFAAAWAEERGLIAAISDVRRSATYFPLRSLRPALSTFACLLIAMVGLVVLTGRRVGALSIAAFAVRHAGPSRVSGVFVGSNRLGLLDGGAGNALGLVLLLIGFTGVALTLWAWKPWSARSRSTESEQTTRSSTYF